MENTNTVSIPLVDVLSELTGKRVVMSGDDYVFFENLEKVSQDKIDEALVLKAEKERELKELNRINAINQKANEIIEVKYPFQFDQINIRAKGIKNDSGEHYTDADVKEMDMFIDAVRLKSKQAKANGTQPEDIDWVGLYK